MNKNPELIPLRQFTTMTEARAECARIGITPARSLKETQARIDAHHVANVEHHQPCQGCETIKAEAAKLCDCDPVGDAAREHYQGVGKQPCECQPDDTVDAMAYATQQPVIGLDYGSNAVPKGELYALRRWKPRQDVGPISRYMDSVEQAFLGLSLAHRKGPRRSSTYRAARRNEAKFFRREARDQGAYRVPA